MSGTNNIKRALNPKIEYLSKKLEVFLDPKNMKPKTKHLALIRKGESMANLSGLLNGQTDPILTINGRKAGNVLYPGLYKSFDKVAGVWASDLQRSFIFADIATGFYGEGFWKKVKSLREIDFGDVSLLVQYVLQSFMVAQEIKHLEMIPS